MFSQKKEFLAFFGTLNVQPEEMSVVWLIPFVLKQKWLLEGDDLYITSYLISRCNLGENWYPLEVS